MNGNSCLVIYKVYLCKGKWSKHYLSFLSWSYLLFHDLDEKDNALENQMGRSILESTESIC